MCLSWIVYQYTKADSTKLKFVMHVIVNYSCLQYAQSMPQLF